MALSVIRILCITILIQAAVASIIPSVEEIGGVLKSHVRSLLNQSDNLVKVLEVFKETKKNAVDATEEARKKIASYAQEGLPADMKKLLEYIASTPDAAFKQMEPMLREIQKLNQELEQESFLYRVIARPVWSIVGGLQYYVGFILQTVAEILQLFTGKVQKGADAYYKGKPQGQSELVNNMLEKVNSGLEKVKSYGDGIKDNSSRKTGSDKGTSDGQAGAVSRT